MVMDEWEALDQLVKEVYSGSTGPGAEARQATPRAKLDIALMRLQVEQMQQSTKVVFPALAELVSEIKRHREALVAAAQSSDRSAWAIIGLTVVIALAAVAQVVVPLVTAK